MLAHPSLVWLVLAVVSASEAKPSLPIGLGLEALGDPAVWITNADYPTSALRDGRQGRSIVEVIIDARGHGVRCRVLHASGTVTLDQNACAALLRRGRWRPTLDDRNQPIFAVYRRQIYWSLPDPREPSRAKAPMPPDIEVDVVRLPVPVAEASVIVRQIQSAEGRIESCIVAVPSTARALDAAACGAAAALTGHDPVLDGSGAPVRGARWRKIQFREVAPER